MKTFKYLSSESKIWIYQSSRAFTSEEHTTLNRRLIEFCRQWTAHDNQLVADFDIVYDHFVILVVDESGNAASGCSIDKSVRFLKDIGNEFGVDFFDKLQIAYMEYGEIHTVPYGRLKDLFKSGEIDTETRFFDCNILKLSDYQSGFLKPLGQHWLKAKVS